MPTALLTTPDTLDPQIARGRYGVAIRDFGEGSLEVEVARAALIEANIAAAIKKHREGSPPLSAAAVKRLTAMLKDS